MTKTDNTAGNRLQVLGRVSYSVFAGVFGTLLITFFLTTFLQPYEIIKIIPWIIALNTAITGYSLLDKTRNTLKHKQAFCVGAGVMNVVITYGMLALLFYYFEGEFLLSGLDFLVYLIIGVVCSELGALLAIKYFKLIR